MVTLLRTCPIGSPAIALSLSSPIRILRALIRGESVAAELVKTWGALLDLLDAAADALAAMWDEQERISPMVRENELWP